MNFNLEIAKRCGVREAALATYLFKLIGNDVDYYYLNGRRWSRISQKMITVALPFMTVGMVRGSLNKLKRKGIIKSDVLNENRFDHTLWYAFTDYGEEMMDPGAYVL